MDLKRLPPGEMAAPDVDCVTIYAQPDGFFRLEGAALVGAESIAIFGEAPYPSWAEAEAAGMAWADGLGVETLHIATIVE